MLETGYFAVSFQLKFKGRPMLSSTSAQNSLDDTFGCEEAISSSFSTLISEGRLFVTCFGRAATVRFTFTFEIGAGIRLGGHGMEMAGMMFG